MEALDEKDHDMSMEERKEGSAAKPKLSVKALKKLKDVYERRGIIYISRIPPHLVDPMLRKKRKKEGKNTGKNFTEGWVEFEDKSVAKQVVKMLNGQPMGGKRRSAYFYDLWCMKYLPKFKWDHLTEEINYQKAVREQKLAAEISAAKRERDFYLSRVDKAKAVSAILERKRKRAEVDGTKEEESGAAAAKHGQRGAESVQPPAAAEGSQQGQQPAAKRAKGQRPKQAEQPQEEHQRHRGTATATEGGAAAPALPLGAKMLRAYGQRKAKPDSVTDAEAPVLSESMLRLIAGKKRAQRHREAGQQAE
ncbi:hypothetical protein N2152v2_007327 [Parachlorella kessleri]